MVEGDWLERNANTKAHITALDITQRQEVTKHSRNSGANENNIHTRLTENSVFHMQWTQNIQLKNQAQNWINPSRRGRCCRRQIHWQIVRGLVTPT
ncbi:BMC_2a_G0049920.mRNA.1.CDS.1 [Saccharomyces cerevisiae]|nr:BMC_2a_G0049920.mRNA.1.CDS.1 [Saccharomyces cerevisiae]CAI4716348.1 BMB_G0049880.mRNA.1.CDS.1 [Saccharomyces cerevisiae]CAI7296246.1 BMC_2a_G0049920.mRNA.1.CDS.1 [Saccharomyces cerevisiae]CAI7299124.1 BMB_G0049880.mRNA.1.CDS.1 [Saccharomyces cerevisiae]